MFDRLPAAPTLVLLLSLALAACTGADGPTGPTGSTGPTGPTGVAGPGTRIVLSGTINVPDIADTTVVAIFRALPPEAGTANDPPAITCWISPNGVGWLNTFCDFLVSEDKTFLFVLVTGVNGLLYRIVVMY